MTGTPFGAPSAISAASATRPNKLFCPGLGLWRAPSRALVADIRRQGELFGLSTGLHCTALDRMIARRSPWRPYFEPPSFGTAAYPSKRGMRSNRADSRFRPAAEIHPLIKYFPVRAFVADQSIRLRRVDCRLRRGFRAQPLYPQQRNFPYRSFAAHIREPGRTLSTVSFDPKPNSRPADSRATERSASEKS